MSLWGSRQTSEGPWPDYWLWWYCSLKDYPLHYGKLTHHTSQHQTDVIIFSTILKAIIGLKARLWHWFHHWFHSELVLSDGCCCCIMVVGADSWLELSCGCGSWVIVVGAESWLLQLSYGCWCQVTVVGAKSWLSEMSCGCWCWVVVVVTESWLLVLSYGCWC